MSSNDLKYNIDPEFEKFLNSSSNLKVPASKQDKEHAWDKLVQAIEEESVEEGKVVKISYAKIWYSIAAVILVLLAIGTLTYQFAENTLISSRGEIVQASLPDGSEVKLNSDSKIEYRKFGWLSNREISLEGEAFFKVIKGSTFTVYAGTDRKITVTGTEFNVFTRGIQFEVRCFEGSVVVETPIVKSISVKKGEGVRMKDSAVEPIKFETDSIAAPTWIKGEFFFNNASLNEVFEEIGRQFNVAIEFNEFDPHSRVYTGYFKREDLKQALDMVCLPMDLSYSLSNDSSSVIITAPKR